MLITDIFRYPYIFGKRKTLNLFNVFQPKINWVFDFLESLSINWANHRFEVQVLVWPFCWACRFLFMAFLQSFSNSGQCQVPRGSYIFFRTDLESTSLSNADKEMKNIKFKRRIFFLLSSFLLLYGCFVVENAFCRIKSYIFVFYFYAQSCF